MGRYLLARLVADLGSLNTGSASAPRRGWVEQAVADGDNNDRGRGQPSTVDQIARAL